MNKKLPFGVWVSKHFPERQEGAPALFLDRDGVIVREVNYLHRVEDVEMEVGIAAVVQLARKTGRAVVTVTNQAGIDRGIFDWAAFEAVEAEIARRLDAMSASSDLVVACSFHPDHTPDYDLSHHAWRKPGPRMLELSAELLGLNLSASWMIGDKVSDIGAARAAGLAGAIHVLTGHGQMERAEALKLTSTEFKVLAADDLIEAREILKLIWQIKD